MTVYEVPHQYWADSEDADACRGTQWESASNVNARVCYQVRAAGGAATNLTHNLPKILYQYG